MPKFTKINNALPYRNGGATINTDGHNTQDSNTPYDTANITNDHDSIAPYDYNVSVTTASESALAIPNGTTKLEFQARASTPIRWAFQSGKAFYSQDPYFTLKAGGSYHQSYPDGGIQSEYIYFATDSNTVVELRAHTGYGE